MPWFKFLKAREDVIAHFHAQGHSAEEILAAMLMDLEQVRLLIAGIEHMDRLKVDAQAGREPPIFQIRPDRPPIFRKEP